MGNYLTTSQAAKQLGVDRSTVTEWVKQGRLPGVVFTQGGHARIPLSAVTQYLASQGNDKNGLGKALLYLRVRDDSERRLLEAGMAHLVKYAQDKGYGISRVVQEIGPGLDGHRPELERVRAEIQSGQAPYEVIVVETLDRLLLMGGDEFARWAKPSVRVEAAGASSAEADTAYRQEWLLDLYYPLVDALALCGLPPARIEQVVSKGLAGIAEALGLL
jgi:excisionase family DNA binding protein